MKKILSALILFLAFSSPAWATGPTTGIIYSGTANYCTGLTITTLVSGGAITGGSLQSGGTNCNQDTVVYVSGGNLGAFTITASSGGVASAIALYSGGNSYTAGSSQSTFVPLPSSLFTQYGSNPMTVVGNQIVATNSASSGAFYNISISQNPEVYATISTKLPTTGQTMGISLNTDPSTGYGYFIQYYRNTSGTDSIAIVKRSSGGTTQLGSTFSHNISNGDSLELSDYAGTLTLSYKASGGSWVSEVTASDSTFTSGYIAWQTSFGGGLTNLGGGTEVTVNDFVEVSGNTFSGQSAQGVFAPGGVFNLTTQVTAVNGTATTVSGTLASSDSCITVNATTETFSASLTSGSSASNSTPFNFSISSGCATGHLSELTMTVAATTGSGWTPQAIPIWVLVNTPAPPVIPAPYTCSTYYYISVYGQDGDTGTSMGHAWLTQTNAMNTLFNAAANQPGVCVVNEAGLYTIQAQSIYAPGNYAYGLGGVSYGTVPNSSQYLVFKSAFQYGATIIPDTSESTSQAAACFTFDNANAIVIDGFSLEGINNIPLAYEGGVYFNSYLATVPGSFITVINNLIFNHGGGGISIVHSDYLLAEGNTVFGNANTDGYEASGVSDYQAVKVNSTAGFHNKIDRNVIFNNREISDGHGVHSDGNGFIMDDSNNTQNGSAFGAYNQKTLIENNIIFDNGGGGIHLFLSTGVTADNNTLWGNYSDLLIPGSGGEKSEINAMESSNNTFVNNVAQAVQNPSNVTSGNLAFVDGSYGGSGCTISLSVSGGVITAGTVVAAGMNNYLGGILQVDGGSNGTFTITSVNGSGGVTGISLLAGGSGYSAMTATTTTQNSGNNWYNNLGFVGTVGAISANTFNTTATIINGSSNNNILGQNPFYTSIANYNFSVPFGSPAQGTGTSAQNYPSTDFVGNSTNPASVWMGAYQYPLTLTGSVTS